MRRWMGSLAGVFLGLALTAGGGRAVVEPVDPGPFLDRTARFVLHDSYTDVGAEYVGAAVVNFGDQRLVAYGDIIADGRPGPRETLREFLGRLQMPWKFAFYRVSTAAGQLLGYILVHEDVSQSFFLNDEEGYVFVHGEDPGDAGDDA